MEYIKFTSIIKGQGGDVVGLVSIQKINGESFLDWSLGQLNTTDELIFTMSSGKKLQFSGLAKRGKKKVFSPCEEFRCDIMKSGRKVATGRTSNYVDDNLDVINYVNSFSSDKKQILKDIKADDDAKVEDAFEGKVATYNYYKNELPEEVASDAKAIVEGVENNANVSSKPKSAKNSEKSNNSQVEKVSNSENKSPVAKNKSTKSESETKTSAPYGGDKAEENSDKNSDKKPIENSEEKDIRSRKNVKIPTDADDLDDMEINKEPYGEPFDSENDEKNSDNNDTDNDDVDDDGARKWNDDNATFYESIKEQLDDLFAKFPKDSYLNEIIPSSNWAKVTYDESGRTYSVGILTDGEEVLFIGYGVIADYSEQPPKELNKNAQWVPLNFTKPHGKGYWM
ncbi:MAG: hypothetical protein RR107_05915, partial [Clostridia bacterium]